MQLLTRSFIYILAIHFLWRYKHMNQEAYFLYGIQRE